MMYVEKAANDYNGPAWIGYVEFSRTGQSAYFNGQAFSGGRGNCRNIETGEYYWITGVKKRGSNRRVFGHGKVLVSRDAHAELLALNGWDALDETNYALFDAQPTDIAKFTEMQNAKHDE